MATRSCSSCRAYQYEKGEVVQNRTNTGPMKRLGKVPCDTREGCPKGHYSKPLHRISEYHESLIALYYQQRATSGAVLTKAERRCPILMQLFGQIDRLVRAREMRDSGMAVGATMAQLKGLGL